MRRSKGYTMIELILGLALIGMVVYGLGVFIVKGMDAWQLLRERNILQTEARSVSARMLSAFRTISSTSEITAINPGEFGFAGKNFRLDNNGSAYSLNYNGNSLSNYLASDGLNFTYLDVNGNSTLAIADIRAVRFEIKFKKGPEHFEIQSSCRLRTP